MELSFQSTLLYKINHEINTTGVWEDISQKRGNWQKQEKPMWNWGKKAKYGLKIKEKTVILAHR